MPLVDNFPLVVIGMPVFNEEKHLEEAISSILNQTYNNIIINIVDNCSTDNTSEICKKFIAMDARVKYIRNDRNINSGLNFLKAVEISQHHDAKYFCFARGDAFYSKNVIYKCIEKLEYNDEIILTYPIPYWVDSYSNIIKEKPVSYYSTLDNGILSRAGIAIWNKPFQMYGLIRFDNVIEFYKNYSPYIGEDNAMMFYLSLNGKFDTVNDEGWYRRYNYKNETYYQRMTRYRKILLEKKISIKSYFPNLFLIYKMIGIIIKHDGSFFIKIKLFLVLIFTSFLRFLESYGKPI